MLSKERVTAALLDARLPLTAYLASVTRNYHLAEDVFQDTCVKAISPEQEFESNEHLLNWAHVAGRNRAIDLMRAKDGKYLGLGNEVLEALAAVWQQGGNQQARDRQAALRICLEKLSEHNREVLRLRYFEGRSGSDVAAILGRKLETIYQSLARIHKLLGECVRRQLVFPEGEG